MLMVENNGSQNNSDKNLNAKFQICLNKQIDYMSIL